MGKEFTNLTEEELCDLMCGQPEDEFETYCDMYEKSLDFQKRIRDAFEKKGLKVYCSYVAVSEESTRTYFCDIEVGGSPETYKRYYGQISEKDLEKLTK